MESTIQRTEAFELSAHITSIGRHGHHLRLVSRVPIARHPCGHVVFQGNFSRAELAALREAITRALEV